MRYAAAGLGLLLGSSSAHAVPIGVEATLSHVQLRPALPIGYAADFGTRFQSVNSVTFESFWTGDLLDPGEEIAYVDAASGVGTGFINVGSSSQSARRVTSVQPDLLLALLDGQASGSIVPGDTTSTTYERLVLSVEGTPMSPIPEPTTLLLFGTTAAGLGLARWRRRSRT